MTACGVMPMQVMQKHNLSTDITACPASANFLTLEHKPYRCGPVASSRA